MSRRVTTKKPVSKFYCKVCFDFGKSDVDYLSHNVRTPKGKVCCPTIMNNRCGKCKNTGHFTSHCKVVINDVVINDKKIVIKALMKEPDEPMKVANTFALLEEDASPRTPRLKKSIEQMDCPWAPIKKSRAEKTSPKKHPKSWADWEESDEE